VGAALGAAVVAAVAGVAVARHRAHRRRRPAPVGSTTQVARTGELAKLASQVGASAAANRARRVFASAERREALDAELELRTAEQVATTLGNMKGALMKLGQLASFLDTAMPESARDALAQLQQDAPPMSAELATGVIEADLEAPLTRLFSDWDPVPIAAASIGQVHRAITTDQRAVAVKVQYPGIENAIRADLDNLDLASLGLPMLFSGLDVRAVADELRARLTEELDYELEAASQRAFADWYRGHPFIHIPEVVTELCGKRVLTTELAEGARFSDMEGWEQRERDLAAETIFRFVFRSLYRMRAFNGDPHPGNYLFGPGGRVTFLDFGLVKRFTPADTAALFEIIRTAVLEPDAAALRVAVERAGFIAPGAPVPDERVAEFFEVFWGPIRQDEITTVTADYASQVSRRYLTGRATDGDVIKWAGMPPAFLILQRINFGLLAILGQLEATANWRRIAEELWPTGGPPSTPLGVEEAAWWAVSHARA
jgi:predicted unusual protein kinase regulating ubiquinone biosynthesis (AarF/ABC1/UbiB family)